MVIVFAVLFKTPLVDAGGYHRGVPYEYGSDDLPAVCKRLFHADLKPIAAFVADGCDVAAEVDDGVGDAQLLQLFRGLVADIAFADAAQG